MLGTPSIQSSALPGMPRGGHDRAAAAGEGAVDAFALFLADAVAPGAEAQGALPAALGEQNEVPVEAAQDEGVGRSAAEGPVAVDAELLAWLATLTEPLSGVIAVERGARPDAIDSGDDGDAGVDAADDADAPVEGLAALLVAAQSAPASITPTTHGPVHSANQTAPLEARRPSAIGGGESAGTAASAPPPDIGEAGGAFGTTDTARPAPPDPGSMPRGADPSITPMTVEPEVPLATMRLTTQSRDRTEPAPRFEPLQAADGEDRVEAPSPGAAWAVAATPSPAATRLASGAVPAASAPAPFAAQLSAAIDSPAFAPALGVQVAMLAHNGIAEARLQIHPAEWGPIAVQIELDGRMAQVNLSAEHGFTRHALEQAMPMLASALSDAGFTLTGGGVFQQPREARPPALPGRPGTRANGASTVDTQAVAVAPLRSRMQQGAVDLYA
jgi:hypothetical protein